MAKRSPARAGAGSSKAGAASSRRKRVDRTAGVALSEQVSAISHQLLHEANSGLPRVDYLARLLEVLLRFSGAHHAALWLKEDARLVRCGMTAGSPRSFRFAASSPARPPARAAAAALDGLAARLLDGPLPAGTDGLTPGGGWAASDLGAGAARSAALVAIGVGDERIGVLGLTSRRAGYFPREAVEAYERLAPILGCALVSQRAQAAVHERVKELTCLYGITQLSERPHLGIDELLVGIVRLLPAAWQYPEIAAARIALDGRSHATSRPAEGPQRQSAEIVVNRARRGEVAVSYLRRRPDIDEGPFLKEERSLIDAVARQVALIVERREAAAERAQLESQLRHADRLATIGQLAAGVAHELNEPLANVLGFAQLAKKEVAAPDAVDGDLDKIVAAALRARDVVKNLMLFARQTPPTTTAADLNEVVSEGLYLVEARCAKQGIELVRRLEPDLPRLLADPSQLRQVVVNLGVNAVQAMPDGGRLTISTRRVNGHVALVVEDTGVGMTEDVRRQIFVPFFTTKDVNEGTGLGLSVVHGIVEAHGGTILVESEPGRGSRFEIRLPLGGLAAHRETDANAIFW